MNATATEAAARPAAATHRIVNFSAGPALLPLEVVEEARDNLLSLGRSGLGIMEMSHRGKEFTAIIERAEADLRELLGVGPEFAVLFLTGGATTQFFMAPMNFLAGGKKANYINTGVWAKKAIAEAKRFGGVHIAATSEDRGHTYIPATTDCAADAVYTHYTSNNTIYGTQFRGEPGSPVPLVCDASSDALSRPVDLARHAMFYAGAQKNIGIAGVTVVVINKEFAERGAGDIPAMLQYRTHIAEKSLSNTAPVFPIYVTGLVLQWLKRLGGLAAIEARNEAKAAALYTFLESSDFWRLPVERAARSRMNVVWRLPSEELEKKLVGDAEAAGFSGIKGHRSAGGLRASIYNAMPIEQVRQFTDFLKAWEATNG